MASIKEHFDQLPWTDENKKVGEEYLKVIRANYKECSERFGRGIRTLTIAIIVLELITQAIVSEFSFAGLKFHNLLLIQKILPVAIAYLYYYLATNMTHRRMLMQVHEHTMIKLHPDYVSHKLHLYAEPPSAFQVDRIFEQELKDYSSRCLIYLTYPLMFMMTLGPIIYIAYTYYRAFEVFGNKDVIVWIGLIISIVFILQVIFLFKGLNRLTGGQPDSKANSGMPSKCDKPRKSGGNAML